MGGDKSGRDRKERAKKRGKARDEGAAGEGGEPPPPAVVTVPRHDVVARFLRDHEAVRSAASAYLAGAERKPD